MKNPIIHSITIASSAISLLSLSSCALDPGYRAYQAKQKTAAAANSTTGSISSATNPYGVPQASNEVGSYAPPLSTGGEVPFQPIPGITQTQSSTNVPSTTATQVTPNPSSGGSSYEVVPGDSLWKISRQFGSTVEAIQAANGLTTTGIRSGQTLIIPSS